MNGLKTYLVFMTSCILLCTCTGAYSQDTIIDSVKSSVNEDSLNYRHIIRQIHDLNMQDPVAAEKRVFEYADSILLVNQENDTLTISRLGYLFYSIDKFSEAEKYYNKLYEYREYQQDSLRMGAICYVLGLCHYFRAQYRPAIEDLQRSYLIAVNIRDINNQISSLLSLGSCYRDIKDLDRATEYLSKAYQLKLSEGSEFAMQYILNDLGDIESAKKNYMSALEYHKESEKYARLNNDNYKLAHVFHAIGIDYQNIVEYDSSLVYLNKALDMEMARKERFGTSRTLAAIGHLYRNKNKNDTALKYFRKQLEVCKLQDSRLDLAFAYQNIAFCCYELQSYDSALYYLKLNRVQKDSIHISESKNEYSELQAHFENEMRDQEINLVSRENELNKLKIEKNLFLVLGFIVFLLLISVTALVLYRRGKIQTTRKIVEISQQNLRFQMNPHFIFNTLNSIQYFLFRNNRSASNLYLTKFARLMKMILENSHHQTISIDEEMKTLVLYLDLEKLRFKDKLKYSISIDESIDLYDYNIPTLLIQPFVENAIIHGIMPKEGNGHILIDLNLKDDRIICTVTDDGIGRKTSRDNKNRSSKNTISLGTRITQNRLNLISSLYKKDLKIVYTDLEDNNGEADGTIVEISFPKII
jgi:tetratricopeptide (TPR) repeat protein